MTQSAYRAARSSLILSILRIPIQVIAQALIARALGPEAFGLFGLGLVVFTFAVLFSELGFGITLYRRNPVRAEDLQCLLTWQVLIGAALAAILYWSAPQIAALFGVAALTPVIQAMAIGALINCLGWVSSVMLGKEMRFRELGQIELGAYVAGYVFVGIPAARAGWGVSALIAAWLTALVVKTVWLWIIKPLPLRPRLIPLPGLDPVPNAVTVTALNLVNWSMASLDRFAAGRLLGLHGAGVYVGAFNLSNTISNALFSALQPTMMARGAQLLNNRAELRRTFTQALAAVWILLGPMFALLSANADDVIAIAYGPRFEAASPILAILALFIPAFLSWSLSTPILWNTGRGRWELLGQLPVLAVAVVALVTVQFNGVPVSALGLAWASAALVTARMLSMIGFAIAAVELPARRVAATVIRGSLLALLAVTLTLLLRQGLSFDLLPVALRPVLRLVTIGFITTGAMWLLIKKLPWLLGVDAIDALHGFAPRIATMTVGPKLRSVAGV